MPPKVDGNNQNSETSDQNVTSRLEAGGKKGKGGGAAGGGGGKKGKGKKGKGKKKKKNVEIDWAADAYFDENRAMIYIEHTEECPVFKDKAIELKALLEKVYPKKIFQMILNEYGKQQPREGAFEVTFSKNARTSRTLIWSGVDRGPPRREKFPIGYEEILNQVDRILKKQYIVLKEESLDAMLRDSPEPSIAIANVTEGETNT